MISREQIERIVRANLDTGPGTFEKSVRSLTDALVDGVLHEATCTDDPLMITPADRWQMVARNLAQTLSAIADHLMRAPVGSTHGVDPHDLRTAFARQCRSAGLRPQ